MHGVWLRVRDLIYLDLGMGLSQGAAITAAAKFWIRMGPGRELCGIRLRFRFGVICGPRMKLQMGPCEGSGKAWGRFR